MTGDKGALRDISRHSDALMEETKSIQKSGGLDGTYNLQEMLTRLLQCFRIWGWGVGQCIQTFAVQAEGPE